MAGYQHQVQVGLLYTGPDDGRDARFGDLVEELDREQIGQVRWTDPDDGGPVVSLYVTRGRGGQDADRRHGALGMAVQRLEAALADLPFEVMMPSGFRRPPDLPLYVALNAGCNLKCWYCTEHGENRSFQKPQLSKARLIELLQAAYASGYRTFRFTGGEPTSRAGVAEILAETQALGDDVRVAITTNGAHLDRLLPALGGLREPKVFLSVDGVALGGSEPPVDRPFGIEKWLTDELLELVQEVRRDAYVRFNYVLTRSSATQFAPLLGVARQHEIDVKVFELLLRDFYFVHGQPKLEVFERQYVSVQGLVKQLEQDFGPSEAFTGLGGRGIPMRSFSTGKNKVIYFDSSVGAHYTPTKCGPCSVRRMCQEGLYAPLLNASGTLHPAGCMNTKLYTPLATASDSDVARELARVRSVIHKSKLEPRGGLRDLPATA